jgi:hypothetical protein
MIDQKTAGRASVAYAWSRGWAVVMIAAASLAMAGCATGGGETGSAPPPSADNSLSPGGTPMQVQPGKPGSTVGVWEGLSLANCNTSAANRCNAQNKISITLLQGDSGLRGFYTCGYSTMDCLGQNETGKVIEASLNGGQITARVEMPDGTSCIYTGRTVGAGGNSITGGYSCYGGGALIESGSWQGRRSY